VLSVMCAYNRINDVHACENEETLGDLRGMGFSGWVMSDWMATHHTGMYVYSVSDWGVCMCV